MISRRKLLYVTAGVTLLQAVPRFAAAAPNISANRIAPKEVTDQTMGLGTYDGSPPIPPSALDVALLSLGGRDNTNWTLESVGPTALVNVYRIKNDTKGLYLTMSEGDQNHSRVLLGSLSNESSLIPTQEWTAKVPNPKQPEQFVFLTKQGFAMTFVETTRHVWLEAQNSTGKNQIWQVS